MTEQDKKTIQLLAGSNGILEDRNKLLKKENKELKKQLSLYGVGCSSCEEIPKESFYLGMTCGECNKPFRVVKNKQ